MPLIHHSITLSPPSPTHTHTHTPLTYDENRRCDAGTNGAGAATSLAAPPSAFAPDECWRMIADSAVASNAATSASDVPRYTHKSTVPGLGTAGIEAQRGKPAGTTGSSSKSATATSDTRRVNGGHGLTATRDHDNTALQHGNMGTREHGNMTT